MSLKNLGLHSHILPALRIGGPTVYGTDWDSMFDEVAGAVVFDCRDLDLSFLLDSGDAAYSEYSETTRPVRLPFDDCYFEFSNQKAIFAGLIGMSVNADLDAIAASNFMDFPPYDDHYVEFTLFNNWRNFPVQKYVKHLYEDFGQFPSKIDPFYEGEGIPTPFFDTINCEHDGRRSDLEEGARLLLGVLSLMEDRLIATEIRPDPCRELNRARVKKGRLPVSSETRVLTINTGAVRRVAAMPTGETHGAPRLHWRRGHWRVIHRGSEFESRTWVRRCLVGDPDAGYVQKDYRVVWQPPMLSETDAASHRSATPHSA